MSDDLSTRITLDTTSAKQDLADLADSGTRMGQSIRTGALDAQASLSGLGATANAIASKTQAAAELIEGMKDVVGAGIVTITEAFHMLGEDEYRLLVSSGNRAGKGFMDELSAALASERSKAVAEAEKTADALAEVDMRNRVRGGGAAYAAGPQMISDADFARANAMNAQAGTESATAFVAAQEAVYSGKIAEIKLLQAQGFISPKDANALGVKAMQAFNTGLIEQSKSATATAAELNILGNSLKTVNEGSNLAGAGLGRIKFGLISLVASASGTIPVLDRIVFSMLGMGIGSGPVIAVLAGLAAVALIWKAMTADADALREKQDKLTKSLDDWYDAQQEGAAGKFGEEIEAQTAKVDRLTQSIIGLKNVLPHGDTMADAGKSALVGIGALTGQLSAADPNMSLTTQLKAQLAALNPFDSAERFLHDYYDKQVQALHKGSEELVAAINEAQKKELDAYAGRQTQTAAALSSLLASGQATPGERSLASNLQGQLRQDVDLAQQAVNNATPDNITERLDQLNKLRTALKDVTQGLVADPFDKVTKALHGLGAETSPVNAALYSFDESVKATKKELADSPAMLGAFTEAVPRLRDELYKLQVSTAFLDIGKSLAALDTGKVDDLTNALLTQEAAWKKQRSAKASLNDPDLLKAFDDMKDKTEDNKVAMIALQAVMDPMAAIEGKLTDETVRLTGQTGDYREKAIAQLDILYQQLDATKLMPAAHKAVQDAIAQVNAKLVENTNLVNENTKGLMDQARAIAARNTEAGKKQIDTSANNISKTNSQMAEFQAMNAAIDKELLDSIARFAERGTFSFRSFFNEVEGLSLRLLGTVDSTLVKLQSDLAQAIKSGADAQAKATASQIESFKELQKVAVVVGAAITGATVGYNVGQYTNSGFNGAGVGGVVGGVSGLSIGQEASKATGIEGLGAWGAVIGGLTGVIGGLLGAADAHRRAAQAITDAAKSLATNIASYTSTSPVQGQLTDNQSKHDALILQAQQLASARLAQANKDNSPAEANAALQKLQEDTDAINAGKAQNAQKIASDFWKGITEQLNALNGPAGAYANQMAAIEEQYRQNVLSAKALEGDNADLTGIERLRTAQEAALTAAENERLAQLQLSLDAREANAKGLTAEGDAITRRAQEEAEIFKAQQDGYTAAQIAQLKYIQGLEDEAAAKKALTDATQTLAANLAAGPSGTLSQQQSADRQPLLDKQASDIAAYNAAVDRLAADTLAGADAATIAADKQAIYTDSIITAGDAAGLAAKAWQDAVAAINQSNSDIAAAVSGGHITGQAGLDAERGSLGTLLGIDPSTITDAILNGLYNDPTKGELTNAQRDTNRAIDQYMSDEKKWGTAIADSLAGAAAGVDTYNKSSIGTVSQISDSEALGILGRLDTSNYHLSAIESLMRQWLGGGQQALTTPAYVNGPSSATFYVYLDGETSEEFLGSINNPRLQAMLDRAQARGFLRQRASAGAPRQQ